MQFYAPGTRKNRYWVVRGSVDGRPYELSTRTTNERIARQRARQMVAALAPRPRVRTRNFRSVAEAYMQVKTLGEPDQRWLRRLADCRFQLDGEEYVFGDLPIGEIVPAHVHAAARALYPGRTHQTMNRQAITPASAVLHFANENGWRDYLRVRKFEEPKPESRRPADDILPTLIEHADDPDLKLFLQLIYFQGWRATETIDLRWEDIDLKRRVVNLRIPKSNARKIIVLEPHSEALLQAIPKGRRRGKLFRWASYQSMHYHLKKLRDGLGITFTPHQARHLFATDLNDGGATPADICNVGSWTSPKSVERYIGATEKRQRAVLSRRRGNAA